MALEIIVTTAGRAALVNAENTGTDPVTITQIGLTQLAFTAGAGAAVLPDEFKRIAGVGGLVVADDTIHVSALDESDDAYSLRGFALYLADGTLFALYGQADPILVKTAESIGGLIADVVFADIDAALLTFGNTEFTNPPATEEVLGVVEFADGVEAAAAVANRALSAFRAKAVLMTWLVELDGAGSGLDADLLDGQQGSYYANIPARLGYTPLNITAYTAADVLAKLLTVDGAGSGVDADLLDGQQGSFYTNIIARLGYTPLDAAQFTAAQILTRLLTVDGSGSLLDADMLDGLHASAFVQNSALTTGTNENGRWWKTPDGAGGTVIEQQNRAALVMNEGTFAVTFPIPFTDVASIVVDLTIVLHGIDSDMYIGIENGTLTVNGFTARYQSTGTDTAYGYHWRAKGY